VIDTQAIIAVAVQAVEQANAQDRQQGRAQADGVAQCWKVLRSSSLAGLKFRSIIRKTSRTASRKRAAPLKKIGTATVVKLPRAVVASTPTSAPVKP
jgi:hypothetical protein